MIIATNGKNELTLTHTRKSDGSFQHAFVDEFAQNLPPHDLAMEAIVEAKTLGFTITTVPLQGNPSEKAA